MTPERAEGIVLKTTPYGDSDLVVQLLLRTGGRAGAFARSARKSRRRFRGGLQPFQHLSIAITAPRGGQLHGLRETETLCPFHGIAADLHRLAAGSRLLDLLLHTLHDGEGGDPAFSRILSFLHWLNTEERGPAFVETGLHRIELLLLGQLGLLPDLEASARSGQPVEDLPAPVWIPDNGIVDDRERATGERGVHLGKEGVEYIRCVSRGSFAAAELADGQAALREALDLTWRNALGRDLGSRGFYRDVFLRGGGGG